MTRRAVNWSGESSAADAVDAFAGAGKKRKRRGTSPKRRLDAGLADVERRIAERDWDNMRPMTLVSVFVWCHRRTYGVTPAELEKAPALSRACMLAANLVKREFENDFDAALAFIRWTWEREDGREQWRRRNQRDGSKPLSWSNQFSPAPWLMTDYKVHLQRMKGSK